MNKMWDNCPKCKTDNVYWNVNGYESEGGTVWREHVCAECDFEWREVYEFAHNETLDCKPLDEKGNVIKDENVIIHPVPPSELDI